VVKIECKCGLNKDGELYVWGASKDGALGLGKTREVSVPTLVPGLGNVFQASCSTSEHHVHTAAITSIKVFFI
jgi:alpha-tubulin suppressor-like RCC1 family protein